METALDFSRLQTPAHHGGVLVEPDSSRLAALVEQNRRRMEALSGEIGGIPLAQARQDIRKSLGFGDRPLIVCGHQPDFIHAGVWSKHVMTMRLAEAAGGDALNLVVDHDAPRAFALIVPRVQARDVRQVSLRYADWPSGAALEGIPTAAAGDVDTLAVAVAAALGPLHEQSQLPHFWQACRQAENRVDWVEQVLCARSATEHQFGVRVNDRRVSHFWYGPLLCRLLTDGERFASAYNRALANYRTRENIAGQRRPMPDLLIDSERCETALWIYRIGQPRQRLFVERRGSRLALFAGHGLIAEWPAAEVASWPALERLLAGLGGWVIRPRALTLTLWARLLLADLFIHGIGGAKYDRITDELLRSYFGIAPPAMACVSATLRLPIATSEHAGAELHAALHAARDLRFNPQRHLPGAAIAELADAKSGRIAEARRLRNDQPAHRRERLEVFQSIRALNARMLERDPGAARAADARIEACLQAWQSHAAASDRTYFFAMHRRADLELLLAQLPGVTQLRGPAIV